MTEMAPLIARITSLGVSKVFLATTASISVNLSHFAFGHGIAGVGYNPTGAEVALKSEFLRFPVGAGERIEQTLFLQGYCPAPHQQTGWVSEIGLFLDDGTLFALYSAQGQQISFVGEQDTIVQAMTIGLDALPVGSVNWTATGPNVNIMMAEPIALLATAIAGLQEKLLATDVSRLSPNIQILKAGM